MFHPRRSTMKKRRIRSRLWLDECGAGAAFFVGTTCRKEAASRGIRRPEMSLCPIELATSHTQMQVHWDGPLKKCGVAKIAAIAC